MNRIFRSIAALFAASAATGAYALESDKGPNSSAPAGDAYMLPADSIITIAGTQVRMRAEGPVDAPPVVLLHGFLFSLESWDAWAAELSKTYRVYRYDLLGHGLTGPDPLRRYAPVERAAFLSDVMDAIGLDRAIIAGNSLGGLAAWRFAAANPERVDALILVAPGGYSINGVGDDPLPAPEPVKAFFRTAPEAGVIASLQRIFADAAFVTPERVALMQTMMQRDGNGEAFIQSIEEFSLPDPDTDLAKIKAPTLLLWGDKDNVIPVDHAARFEAAIKNAELMIYADVGHVPQEEASSATLSAVLTFLTDPQGGSQ